MAALTLNITYRPLKVGLCVREDNIEDVIKAAGINTILWGGIYNPIIPVGRNKEFPSRLVKLFQVDVLYPVAQSSEIETFIKQHPYLEWPDHYGNILFAQNGKGVKLTMLDISHIIGHWWEKEFKVRKKSNCVLFEWGENDPLAPVFSVEFGHFLSDTKLLYDYHQAYKQGLRAKLKKINKTDTLEAEIAQRVDPIHVTEDRLQLAGSTWGWESHGIYIGDHTSAQDLINFWNLRASAIDVRFTPVNYTKRLKQTFIKHIIEIHKKDSAKKFPSGVGVWCRSELNEVIVNKIINSLFPDGTVKARHHVDQHIWNGLNIKPPKPVFESKTILANIDWPYGSPIISFQLPQKPIEKENSYNSGQQLICEVHPFTEFEYKGYTLKLPYLPDLNEWYARHILVTRPWSLRVSKDGIGIIQKLYEKTETLHPVRNTDLIKKIFDRAKVIAKDSPPGIITQRLIERMGDLDGCRFLKITGVRKLLELPPNRSIDWEKAVRTIGQGRFDRFKSLYIIPRKEKELKPVDVWAFLLKLSIFIPKVKFLYKILPIKKSCKCNYCGSSSKIPLSAFEKHWICPYCDREQYLPVYIKTNLNKNERRAFNFKRSGLFAKDNKQGGAIPIILTLLQLLRRVGIDEFVYSTALKLDSTENNINCEIDFVVLDTDYQGNVYLAIGECKTIDQITQRTIAKLLNVRDVLNKSGIETHLIFSKIPSFSKREITRFKNLITQGISPILFTEIELEPYEPYDYYHENNIKLPEPYPHSFDGMAQNSKVIYLNKT